MLTQPFSTRTKIPSPPCVQSLRRNRLLFEPLSISTHVESRACTSPGSFRSPCDSRLSRTRFSEACHSFRQVFDVCEKSFAESVLRSLSTSTHPSQTRFARLLCSTTPRHRSSTIPPRRPCSPHPNAGSWKLSEKSQPSIRQSSQSISRSPVSNPCTRRLRTVTPRTPRSTTPVPWNSFGCSPPGPTTTAPPPSITMSEVSTTSGPNSSSACQVVGAVITVGSSAAQPADTSVPSSRPNRSPSCSPRCATSFHPPAARAGPGSAFPRLSPTRNRDDIHAGAKIGIRHNSQNAGPCDLQPPTVRPHPWRPVPVTPVDAPVIEQFPRIATHPPSLSSRSPRTATRRRRSQWQTLAVESGKLTTNTA